MLQHNNNLLTDKVDNVSSFTRFIYLSHQKTTSRNSIYSPDCFPIQNYCYSTE